MFKFSSLPKKSTKPPPGPGPPKLRRHGDPSEVFATRRGRFTSWRSIPSTLAGWTEHPWWEDVRTALFPCSHLWNGILRHCETILQLRCVVRIQGYQGFKMICDACSLVCKYKKLLVAWEYLERYQTNPGLHSVSLFTQTLRTPRMTDEGRERERNQLLAMARVLGIFPNVVVFWLILFSEGQGCGRICFTLFVGGWGSCCVYPKLFIWIGSSPFRTFVAEVLRLQDCGNWRAALERCFETKFGISAEVGMMGGAQGWVLYIGLEFDSWRDSGLCLWEVQFLDCWREGAREM